MTFDELKLLCAIHESYPGCGDPVTNQERLAVGWSVSRTYSRIFQTTEFPWNIDQVMMTFYKWRKNTITRRKAEIALSHGFDCFWRHRGKGPCCEEVEAGHLVSKSQGGPLTVENAIIECRAHNNQRREMTIEEYLVSGVSTACLKPT